MLLPGRLPTPDHVSFTFAVGLTDRGANLSVEDLDKELDAYRRSKDPAKALDADMDDYWKARVDAKAAAASTGASAEGAAADGQAQPAEAGGAAATAPANPGKLADSTEKLKLDE
eukprot:jgi/Mesvir1/210/Mv13554-RA.1